LCCAKTSAVASSALALGPALSALLLSGCSSESRPPENLAAQGQALTQLTNQIGRLTTSGNSQRRTPVIYDALGRAKAAGPAVQGTEYVYTNQYGYPKRALGPTESEPGTVLQSTRLPDGEIVRYEYDGGGGQQKVTAGSDVIVAGVRRNAKGQTIS